MRTLAIRTAGFLAAAWLLGSCRPAPSPTIVADASLMMLVPADAQSIFGVRLKELKTSPIYQQLVAQRKLPQLDQFTAETGIDPRKDIWEIVVAANAHAPVVLVRGKFVEGGGGAAGMEPEIKREGVRRFNYKGYTLIGDEKVAVTFLNTSVAVAGKPDSVRRVIDGRDGSLGRPPQDLLDRIARIPSANEIYFVSKAQIGGALPPGLPGPLSGLKSMPVDIQSATFAADLSAGVHVTGEVTSRDDASARKLHDAARGLIGLGRLSTPDGQPQLLQFYDGIQVKQTESTVALEANVPLELFQRFLEMARSQTRLNP